jgi:hypothetical protein
MQVWAGFRLKLAGFQRLAPKIRTLGIAKIFRVSPLKSFGPNALKNVA